MRPFVRLLALLVVLAPAAHAQQPRPIPYPVMPPPAFERALANGTRSPDGRPGPKYWTNTADYTLEATLSPATRLLRGHATVVYHNRSPQPLRNAVVHLRQNLNAEGVIRNRPQRLTGGVRLGGVTYEGQPLLEQGSLRTPGYAVDGTLMRLALPAPIPAGGKATFTFAWSFEVPEAGAPRMGQDGEVFYLGYWYPQFAVYNDLVGWAADPYMGNGEFYMGYGTYDVRLTVPEGWVVGATGTLQNPEEVLSAQTRERLARAARTRETVSIVGEDERRAGTSTATSPTGALTWHFKAADVRDFAFGTSDLYVWDATSARVGDRDGDGRDDTALIHALYRPGTTAWNRSAEFSRFTIEYLSEALLPYPYPHMTAVEGIIGGGMEYPMITLIGGARSDRSLFGVTIHEIAHMWFPMIVGQNEKAYTWMDEGLTSFNTNDGASAFFKTDAWDGAEASYYLIAGTGAEVESMRHGDLYPPGSPARGIASYGKPALAFHALRGLVGKERFEAAYREYARRWAYKHPEPYDLFNTFEDVLGQDLDWFWRTLFYETWTLDHAVADVVSDGNAVVVTVADRGLSPLPVPLRVVYADGRVEEQTIPVDVWLGGARQATARFPAGTVQEVVIDPAKVLPDVDRSNNTWRK